VAITPQPAASPSAQRSPAPAASATPQAAPTPAAKAEAPKIELAKPEPAKVDPSALTPMPVAAWTVADAQALLAVIATVDSEGLYPRDYQPEVLRAAIGKGPGATLDEQASRSFDWLAEDLRDGRTPFSARVQWFAVDTDQDDNTTEKLLTTATTTHDVAGVLAGLLPTHPAYAALKAELAHTAPLDAKKRAALRVNLDRWRWMRRDLGQLHLLANVPEFMLRVEVADKTLRSYKVIVGKPGKTATPQLAEEVKAVVFNPTWTVPQSIVKGEGLGEKLYGNPASALRQGYKVTRSDDGTYTVVQQPGDKNSLGRMKIDMPNPHAIYLHDTPNKSLFNATMRAFSHGCLRTQDARVLGMTIAILTETLTKEEAGDAFNSTAYKRVVLKKGMPVYIAYFTYGQDVNGVMTQFADIYNRDGPVLASFRQPRQLHTMQRSSAEEVIKLDNPL